MVDFLFAFRCGRLLKKTVRRVCEGCVAVCPSACLHEARWGSIAQKKQEYQENAMFLYTPAPKTIKNTSFFKDLEGPFLAEFHYAGNLKL